MGIFEICLSGVALSMDACAVAMTNGMSESKMPLKKVLLVALFFGFFQFLMPVVGFFITKIVADAFIETFESISAWISCALLAILGGRMLMEGIGALLASRNPNTDGCEDCETLGACTRLTEEKQDTLGVWKLLVQAIATSIDALAVGVTLQMAVLSPAGLAFGVWGATGIIGVLTFGLSVGAVYIGKAVGNKLADKAEIFGGVVLIAIGLKILIESFL